MDETDADGNLSAEIEAFITALQDVHLKISENYIVNTQSIVLPSATSTSIEYHDEVIEKGVLDITEAIESLQIKVNEEQTTILIDIESCPYSKSYIQSSTYVSLHYYLNCILTNVTVAVSRI